MIPSSQAGGIIRQVYDPACGTGGMLALTEEALKDFNPSIRVELFGQELNGESFGICKSDMLVTGHDPEQIAFGNTLTQDTHKDKRFHYMLSSPPCGVDWKKFQDPIKALVISLICASIHRSLYCVFVAIVGVIVVL